MSPDTPATDHRAAWDVVLHELDQNAERVLAGDDAATLDFDPPAGLGPLPADLADRARAVGARQQEAIAALTARMGDHRRRVELTDRVAGHMPGSAGRAPAYLDITG